MIIDEVFEVFGLDCIVIEDEVMVVYWCFMKKLYFDIGEGLLVLVC